MDLPIAFGKYELVERIATGGMAEIFLARSFGVAGFEKRLVIKRIREEHAHDPRFVSMFIHEARIGVHLNHPNIVQVYDLGKVGLSWYIAMEHLQGRDLNKVVKAMRAEGKRLPLAVCVAIVAEVCRGLSYAHGHLPASPPSSGLQGDFGNAAIPYQGVVHRDVSPHNLVLTFAGEVKLVDFGIARLMNTETGNGSGNPDGRPGGGKYAYMSPEQALGLEVDHRSDVFSAGIVLWELIVGHRLYQDPDPVAKLERVRAAVITHPASEGIAIDPSLWDILKKALARDRNDRYAHAALFEEDLRAWLYRHRDRVGAADIAAVTRAAFPTEAADGTDAARFDAIVDIDRLIADMDRLDAVTSATLAPGQSGGTDSSGDTRTPDAERKNVVVLMIDVDGLTALSAEVEPEILFRHHFQLLRWLRKIVDRFGGLVQRAVDDQVLVLFGVPRTGADDVARALDCALELRRKLSELRARGVRVELATGVHIGEVNVASGHRPIRYEARGDTTRLARRLSAIADHDQVAVSEKVLRSAGADFRFKRGPDVPQRGGKSDDASYLLLGRHRGLRIARKGQWMRRGNELDVIRRALLDLGTGHGSAIVLTGAEGTGKSRLVREIRDLAVKRSLPVYLGRCASYRDDGDPFADLVRDVLGLDADSSKTDLEGQLERLCQLGLSRRDIDVVAGLIGFREAGTDEDALWIALTRILSGLGQSGPVLVAIEEIHFLGPRQATRLRRLVQAVTRQPVLLLLTHRGALPPGLDGIGTTVELGPFPSSTQKRLLKIILEVDDVDEPIVELVERNCEGNPLYVAEMVKYLVQNSGIEIVSGMARLARPVDEPDLPDSLAGVIAARIDKLDPAAKGALKIAAIAGHHFTERLLGEAIGLEDPTPIINELRGHGLVTPDAADVDTWRFASELVRQATIRGILGVQRRDYHRLVAAAIEKVYASERTAWVEPLAQHWYAGGRPLEAARYAHMGGEAFEKLTQLDRARELYETGLRWIREVPDLPETWDARVQGEATLSLRCGVVSALLADSRRAETALQVALDIASDVGLPWIEVRAHVELGRLHMHRARFSLASAHLTQARELLALSPDAEVWFDALEAQAVLADERERHDEAEALWREVLTRADLPPNAEASALVGLANLSLRSGQWTEAAPLLDQALEAARRAGDRIIQGRVLNNIGLLHSGAGRYDEALDYFRRALEVREGIGYLRGVVINHHNVGDVHFARSDWDRAHVAFTRSREIALEIAWDRGVVLNDVYLAYLEARRTREAEPEAPMRPEALDALRTAMITAERLGDTESALSAKWLCARALAEGGLHAAARETALAAQATARRSGATPMLQALDQLIASIESVEPPQREA